MAINATTAQLTWEPPPLEHRNGIIQEYIIRVVGIDTNEEFEIYSNLFAAEISDLHPFYRYKFAISAQTIAAGPFSAFSTLQMPEAGNIKLYLIYTTLINESIPQLQQLQYEILL